MFVHLSKKIAIPNNALLHTVAWNNDQGWVACGGEEGLLKVLKLETTSTAQAQGSDATKKDAQSNLSMNQTLEGHHGAVTLSTWNFQHRKLTTADSAGVIMVWILYKGVWYEEMVNNRGKSVVADMHWNNDGSKICIAYEDGAVIVGSVDGNRLWGKELKNTQLSFCQWSPDGRFILFATGTNDLQLFDANGTFLGKMNTIGDSFNVKVAGMDWYNGVNGYLEPTVPCLAIGYENGRIIVLRSERDNSPVLIETTMRGIRLQWNPNGTILAVSGVQHAKTSQGEEKEVCVVHFYDPYGQHLRTLKVPGKKISSISWESSGLRIALAVDSYMYFANVRPDYKWSFFAKNVVLYTHVKQDRPDQTIVFWNVKTNERYIKFAMKVFIAVAFQEYCLLAIKPTGEDASSAYLVTICNSIGTSIDTKTIEFEPKYGALTRSHAFIASDSVILFWQYRSVRNGSNALEALRKRTEVKERVFHIDEVKVIGMQAGEQPQTIREALAKGTSSDPIVSICASDSFFIIARASGTLLVLILPSMTFEYRYEVPIKPQTMSLNNTSSKLALVDSNGLMKLFELERRATGLFGGLVGTSNRAGSADSKHQNGGRLLDFERKDVWDVIWASDNADMMCTMEKARLIIFRGLEPEEPIPCSGFICEFEDLTVRSVLLHDVLKDPENPPKEALESTEAKALRDMRNIIQSGSLQEALILAENTAHPRLWRVLADASMEKLDFNVASKALIRSVDYQGLQLVKKLQKLDDKMKQKAEIAAHFGNYEVAEKMYLEIDRRDLATDLRLKLGDWFRVVQLIKSGAVGDDTLLEKSWDAIGDYYYDRQRWSQAVTYYSQGHNTERLLDCYCRLEDYENMEKLVASVSDQSPLLKTVADMFAAVGMCEPAAAAYIRAGDVKKALDTCVLLNQWKTAVELAEQHQMPNIDALFAKCAEYLLERNKVMSAIELYRKAGLHAKSAKLLFELAERAGKAKKDPMIIKQLYVLAALEVERYHQQVKRSRGANENASAALDGLLAEDFKNIGDTRFLDNAWRGAEAYHLLMLANRQYHREDYDSAVRTALSLQNFEDILDQRTIYSVLATCAYQARMFGICSRAFIKLEGIESCTEEERLAFEELAITIFTDHPPKDERVGRVSCTNCGNSMLDTESVCGMCNLNFPTCISSGRPIIEYHHFMCPTCKHRTRESEISGLRCCPLCHTVV